MRIERIQLVESSYFQHSAERLERERKKTHTDQAVSFEDKRSNNQYEHEEKEHLADHEAAAHDEQSDDFDKGAQEQVGTARVNVVV